MFGTLRGRALRCTPLEPGHVFPASIFKPQSSNQIGSAAVAAVMVPVPGQEIPGLTSIERAVDIVLGLMKLIIGRRLSNDQIIR